MAAYAPPSPIFTFKEGTYLADMLDNFNEPYLTIPVFAEGILLYSLLFRGLLVG
jgi:hypothetical protein